MRILILPLAALAALAGCAELRQPVASRPAPVQPRSHGVYEDAKWALTPGTNTITGHAAINGQNSSVRTCAGALASLIPAVTATRSRMTGLYGPGKDVVQIRASSVPARDPDLEHLTKHATCDSQGNFRFTQVPDGEFFVTVGFTGKPLTSVKREVAVHGGETAAVELTN